MNATSRTLLQTVLTTDGSLSLGERGIVQRVLNGEADLAVDSVENVDERLLVTQKTAAEMLSVSRVTIWRMTKECVLHPVEILPGTWRYSYRELAKLARHGLGSPSATPDGNEKSAA